MHNGNMRSQIYPISFRLLAEIDRAHLARSRATVLIVRSAIAQSHAVFLAMASHLRRAGKRASRLDRGGTDGLEAVERP